MLVQVRVRRREYRLLQYLLLFFGEANVGFIRLPHDLGIGFISVFLLRGGKPVRELPQQILLLVIDQYLLIFCEKDRGQQVQLPHPGQELNRVQLTADLRFPLLV